MTQSLFLMGEKKLPTKGRAPGFAGSSCRFCPAGMLASYLGTHGATREEASISDEIDADDEPGLHIPRHLVPFIHHPTQLTIN